MKDGMDYAEMLEMPVSSCDVIIKSPKRKKKNLKEQVIAKVNFDENEQQAEEKEKKSKLNLSFLKRKKQENHKDTALKEKEALPNEPQVEKKKFKFDVLYAEGVAAFLLIAAILLTNIFWEDSGINTVMKNLFGQSEVTQADSRSYLEFKATSPSEELAASLSAGVMTFTGSGAVYPVCDGKVTDVVLKDDKYVLTINHSDVFKTVITGLNYVYAEKGDEAFKYIPVGYVGEGSVTVEMYDGETLLTGYLLENGNIVWES